MHRTTLTAALLATLFALPACVATLEVTEGNEDISEQGDPEGGDRFSPYSTNIPKNAEVEVFNVTVGLNCRTGPSTNYMVARLLAKGERGTVLDYTTDRKWYKLNVGNLQCWSYHYYLRQVDPTAPGMNVGNNVGAALGSYYTTYYYLANQANYAGSGYPIYDKSCNTIVSSTYDFYKAAKMEGSAKLVDGRVINYAGGCSCGGQSLSCFQVLSGDMPWGLGASGKGIIPLRSIAVDKGLIPMGAAIYIKEWDGKTIPSIDGIGGFVHDGCFRADDTGGAINGKHFDFNAGTKNMWQALEGMVPTKSNLSLYIGGGKCAYVSTLTPGSVPTPPSNPTPPTDPNPPTNPTNPANPADASCVNHCGFKAPSGCYCDDQCAQYGDCCGDIQAACGTNGGTPATPPSNPTPSPAPAPSASCQGVCGGQAASGCYCDSTCAQFGDCCSDMQQVCGSSAPSNPTPPPSNPTNPPASNPNGFSGMPAQYVLSRDGVINAAANYVGFSYWWGGAKLPNPWDVAGKGKGTCNSSSYSGHSGTYGADCSGFVGDVWQLPEHNSFESNTHAFSTYNFYNEQTHWTNIDRGSAQKGDAMVYRSGSGGHIVIYESGDPWGSTWTYEARGCSYGIVHNLRTLGTAYKARKRNGI